MRTGSVLITGANGFLGKMILAQLMDSGFAICATDIGDKPAIQGVPYKKADITRPKELKDAVDRVNTVIHAAGLAHLFNDNDKNQELFRQINEIGAANVALAAAEKGARHFILVSSVSVYGPFAHGLYAEDNPCRPVGPYAISKYNSELRVAEIADKAGMALTILRLSTLYGEGDPGNVRRLIRMLDKGRFVWIGDGFNRKSLLYKEDAARACLTVALLPAVGTHVFNISAPPCTMREIVEGISDALGKRPLPLRIPGNLALALSRNLSKLPNRRLSAIHQIVQKWMAEDVYDTSGFERVYGFCAQVEIREGLRREVEWYRNCRNSLI